MPTIDPVRLQTMIKSFTIPCQPEVLHRVAHELKKPNPNLDRVGMAINSDVSMTACILQLANTRRFQEQYNSQFITLDKAIEYLELDRLRKIVDSLIQRDSNQQLSTTTLHRFWDSAMDVAVVSAHLAQKLFCANPDEAYMLGLFRDTGIPIMLHTIPGYLDALVEANLNAEKSLVDIENDRFGINHQTVGYCLARTWRLPEVIARGILTHQYIEPPNKEDLDITLQKNILIALVHLAEIISNRHRSAAYNRVDKELYDDWPTIHTYVLDHLDINQADAEDAMEDTLEKMTGLLADYQL